MPARLHYMALISRQLVLKKVAIAFPDALEAEQALRSLDRYSRNPSEPLAVAVHLAIIKRSEGKLWRLRELVQAARRDFRDVLYPAQAPERFERVRRFQERVRRFQVGGVSANE